MDLAVIAFALIAFGVISRRIDGTPITPAIIFVGVGLLVGTRRSTSWTHHRPARR